MAELSRNDRRRRIELHDVSGALSGMDMEAWQLRSDERKWSILELDIEHGKFFAGEMAAPYIARGASEYVFVFCRGSEELHWTVNGHCVARNEIVLLSPGYEWVGRCADAGRWGAIRVELSKLRQYAELSGATDFALERGQTRFIPVGSEILAELRQMIRVTLDSGSTADGVTKEQLQSAQIARHALSAVVLQLQDSRHFLQSTQEQVVARSLAYLRAHQNDIVYVCDLCLALKISDRWLRESFHRVLRLNPVQFLRIRRLHQARIHLMRTTNVSSVTDVAAMYGFFDFGRFSMTYRELFRELPSTTLKRRNG
jgi:AraC-like DNA-binding protein